MPKYEIFDRKSGNILAEGTLEEKNGMYVMKRLVPVAITKDTIIVVDDRVMETRPVTRVKPTKPKVVESGTVTKAGKLWIADVKGAAKSWPGAIMEYEVVSYSKGGEPIDKKNISDKDKERIRWAVMVAGKEIDTKIGKDGKELTGEKVDIKMKKEWVGKEIIVMACLEGFNKKVSQTTEVKNFPILIVESSRQPGKKKKKNENEKDEVAEDMLCGDMTKEDIFKIFAKDPTKRDSYTKTFGNEKMHFNGFEKQATLLFAEDYINMYEPVIPNELDEECRMSKENPVRVNLERNIISMIQHFQYGSGRDYTDNNTKDKPLTTAVMRHKDTIRFFNEIRKELLKSLKDNDGNIAIELSNKSIKRPSFTDRTTDLWQGLLIAIHDTWAYKVLITEYQLEEDKKTYNGKMKIVIYDHFGLDEEDVRKGKEAHYVDCFYHWFVLQHWEGFKCKYKPFITVIEKEMPFRGKL
jgi:hypothetical protein